MNKEVKKRLLWLSEHKTEDVKEDITYTLDYIRELEREIERLKAIVEGTKENRNELQEEIKRLKEEYVILQNASDEVEEEKDKEIERLNNIIDKAIEYIEIYNEEDNPDYGSAFINKNDYTYVGFDEYRESLLNILRGEDKE